MATPKSIEIEYAKVVRGVICPPDTCGSLTRITSEVVEASDIDASDFF